jgi:heterodisulfide reductase subunit A
VAITVNGLQCVRTEPGEPDASGRSRPEPVKGSEEVIPARRIIAAIGQSPDPSLTGPGDPDLARNRDGTIKVDDATGETSDPRIFAGGDIVAGDRYVTTAMAWGRRAAWAMDRKLRGEALADLRPPPPRPDPREVPPTRARVERADKVPRQKPVELDAKQRARSFIEVHAALTENAARREATRCLVCGMCGNCRTCLDLFGCPAFYVEEEQVHIDPALCSGCGVCVHICPNMAIRRADVEIQPDPALAQKFGPIQDRAEDEDMVDE